MEFFKTGDYTVFESMPVKTLTDLITWKANLEKQKKEALEEDMKKQQNPNKRQYIRK